MDTNDVADDIATLEPYFAELSTFPSSYTIEAAMWPMLSQRVKDALEADLTDAGYELDRVKAVEYEDGNLIAITISLHV